MPNITVICPICKKEEDIYIEEVKEEGLTTFSIPQDLVCKHSFQIFVDTKYQIRSYQKVQREISKKELKIAKKLKKLGLPKDYKEPSPEDKLRDILF